MELFAAAGIDLPSQGKAQARPKRSALPTLRAPLFAYKVVDEAIGRAAFSPDEEIQQVARNYARKVRGLPTAKETTFRPVFIDDVLVRILGYRRIDPDAPYTLADEESLGAGAVDTALGHFEARGARKIVAPFELKGPDTKDLDRIMPGRGKTPVQQAWEYANDAPGAKWVLVSNCVEIRLYGYGRGREAYEVFDLTRLDQPDELRRLWVLLSADNFLGGQGERLLRETDAAYKDVTNRLYKDYRTLRERLTAFLTDSADGPKLKPGASIEPAQKILDRILFIAFAERRDLMGAGALDFAAKYDNPFDRRPRWHNFIALFRSVDKGNHDMDVPPYNGGLFAPDPALDALILPDDLAKDIATLGQWDYRREVPVTVLGHIFEQSITDIEKLRAEARGEAAPKVTKVKREGVVYTPDLVTRFLVERTIGKTLDERRAALRAEHGFGSELPPDKERAFWSAWLDVLRAFAVVDPACGSGAFLVAAFDRLAQEYRPVLARLEDLGAPTGLDIFDEIVTRNLFGVDVNAESVEITRLSLWLKTARRGHRLQSLDATIRVGNSIVSDKAVDPRAFDWAAAFPDVVKRGGFDVVIGNPPYVRMELIKPIKPWLAANYVVAADRTDLYAYFFERGVKLLRAGGRLGFISSSTFFRTGSGENLRTFLTDGVRIESVVDFGDLQIFEGVTTYPAILTMAKGGDGKAGDVAFMKLGEDVPDDLDLAFEARSVAMPRARLGAGSWQFEDAPLARLRDKIVTGHKTLGEVYGAPLRGIATGLNDAFVIDTPTRDRLVAADPKSVEILKPFLRGEDIKRWRVESEGFWLINTPKGKVDIEAYPAIRVWLLPFRAQLEARATKQEWWELQQAQVAYHERFSRPKLIWPQFVNAPSFCVDLSATYPINKCYLFPCADFSLLAFLNSKVLWFVFAAMSVPKRGGFREATAQHIAPLPFPKVAEVEFARLSTLGEACTTAARARFTIQSAVRRRILDLAPPEKRKLNGRLEDWHQLDFQAFLKEIKKHFRADVPLKQRGEWETYLADNAREVARFTAEIAAAEAEIDRLVYEAFDLTPDEIALLEHSLEGQY